ncbi:MAG: hypothetical protein ACOCPM_05130 [Bacteroidales bacterium]
MSELYPIESLVPQPFLLNGLKHHLPLIRQYLPILKQMPEHTFLSALKKTGNSVTDFYYGTMNIEPITTEIRKKLIELNVFQQEAFDQWVLNQDDYFCFRISDSSDWLIRRGMNNERYIHIHPGKHSYKTKRIKSRSLRIALAIIYFSNNENDLFSLDFLNKIRKEKLDLPPVKAISPIHKWLVTIISKHQTS